MLNLVYQVKKCPRCGGILSEPDEHSSRVCGSCDAVFSKEAYDDISEHFTEIVQKAIDEAFEDKIAEHRRSLWEEVQKPIQERSSSSIYNHAQSIYTYNQNDIQANFYLASGNISSRQTINFLNKLVKEKPNVYKHYVYDFVKFLMESYEEDFIIPLRNLVSKCFSTNSPEYNDCQDLLDEAAKDCNEGTHDVSVHRDVFIACSSMDADIVWELTQYLESAARPKPLKCFFYKRNLPQGRNADHFYQERLNTAIDNCTVFLFASSKNSRSKRCSGYLHELTLLDPENRKNRHFADKGRLEWVIDSIDDRQDTPSDILDVMERVFVGARWHVGTDKRSMREVYDALVECINRNESSDNWESQLDNLIDVYDNVYNGNDSYVPYDVYMNCQKIIDIMDRDKLIHLQVTKKEKYNAIKNFYERVTPIIGRIGELNEEQRAEDYPSEIKEDIDALKSKFARFLIYNIDNLDINIEAANLENRMRSARDLRSICNVYDVYKQFKKRNPEISSYDTLQVLNNNGTGAVHTIIKNTKTLEAVLKARDHYVELPEDSYERSLYTLDSLEMLHSNGVSAVEKSLKSLRSLNEVIEAKNHYDSLDKDSFEYSLYTESSLEILKESGVYMVEDMLNNADTLDEVLEARRYYEDLPRGSYEYELYTPENLNVLEEKEKDFTGTILSYITGIIFTDNTYDFTYDNSKRMNSYNEAVSKLSPTDVIYINLERRLQSECDFPHFTYKASKGESIITQIYSFLYNEWANQNKAVEKVKSKINELNENSSGRKIRAARTSYSKLTEQQKLYTTQEERELSIIEQTYQSNTFKLRKKGWRITVLISWILSLLITGGFLTFLYFGYIDALFNEKAEVFIYSYAGLQAALLIFNLIGSVHARKVDYDAMARGEKSYSEYRINFGTWIKYIPFSILCFLDTALIAMFLAEGLAFNQWGTANALGSLGLPLVILLYIGVASIFIAVLAFLFAERDDRDNPGYTTTLIESCPGRFFLIVTVLVAGLAAGTAIVPHNTLAAIETNNYDISEYEYADNLLYRYSDARKGIVVYPMHKNSHETLEVPEYINGQRVAGIEKTPVISFAGASIQQMCEDSAKNVKRLKVAHGVLYIGSEVFDDCQKLKSVELPDTITSIGKKAFANCINLHSVNIPKSLAIIGDEAFYFVPIHELTIPEATRTIGANAFNGSDVEKITLNSKNIQVHNGAFGSFSCIPVTINSTITEFQSRINIDDIVFPADGSAYIVTDINHKEIFLDKGNAYEKVIYNSYNIPSIINDAYVEIIPDVIYGLSYKTLNISSSVRYIKLTSSSQKTHSNVYVSIASRAKPLTMVLDNFNFASSTTPNTVNVEGGQFQLAINVIGNSSITNNYPSGNAVYSNSDVTIAGPGELKLNGGNGTHDSTTGGSAIIARSLKIAMTGSLTAIGGDGNHGKKVITNGQDGNDGGTGGIAVKCDYLTIGADSTVNIQGGNGGNGSSGGLGVTGSKGANGTDNSWSYTSRDGGNGGNGSSGGDGGDGGKGGTGLKVTCSITNNSKSVTVTSGAGGNGGAGGKGGNGGAGGMGGSVTSSSYKSYTAGDGGKGGAGGMGGDGGDGGKHGTALVYGTSLTGKALSTKNGDSGSGGAGGMGGTGGDGGEAGFDYYKNYGTIGESGDNGSSGSNGKRYNPFK